MSASVSLPEEPVLCHVGVEQGGYGKFSTARLELEPVAVLYGLEVDEKERGAVLRPLLGLARPFHPPLTEKVIFFKLILKIRIIFCGSRMFYLGSWILIFVHTRSRIQKRAKKGGMKTKLLSYLVCSHKYHKIDNYYIFELVKKKCRPILQRIIELFTPKIVIKLSKI
jgi:hypothetical protein